MQVDLQSQGYTAAIAQRGAELISLRDPQGEEYLWSGDATYWSGRAPILFPVIGRMKGGGYTHKGVRYEMPLHGVVRKKDWQLLSQSEDTVCYVTRADAATRVHYPFDFELRVTFTLDGPKLSIDYEVLNHGKEQMLFSLGSHPAFALPLEAGEGLDSWSVEFSEAETLDCQVLDGGLIGDSPIPKFLDNNRTVQLSDTLFNDDALIFQGIKSQRLDIVHATKGKRVSLHTGGAPDLGIWSKPGAPYVCLEPWYGHDDPVGASGELAEKAGILTLAGGGVFETGVVVEFG